MTPSVRLGLRLAVGTPGQRLRSAFVVIGTGVGSWLLTSTLALGQAIASSPGSYSSTERERLGLSIIAAVAVPILVLTASVGRLSAAVRDRRLANLRLLGLSATGTRAVAATEAAVGAVVGTLAGVAAYVATRPLLVHLDIDGHQWTTQGLSPSPLAWILVVAGLPTVVCGAAVIPVRTPSATALSTARRAGSRRPSLLWALPLLVGVSLCVVQLTSPRQANPGGAWFTLFFAGVILSGLGVVLVAPWVVRGLADLLAAVAPGPATRIAARRLQSQPGTVVRVVSVLMVGLFLVTGARSVLVAFEATRGYADTAAAVHSAQRLVVDAKAEQADRVAARARAVDGVTDVVLLPRLDVVSQGRFPDGGGTFRQHTYVLVATCAQLLRLQPALHGCVDAPMTVGDGFPYSGRATIHGAAGTVTGFSVSGHALTGPTTGWPGALSPLEVGFVVPPDLPGLQPLLAAAPRTGLVIGRPGRDLGARLAEAGVPVESEPDYGYYDFVGRLRSIVWTVAAVVLGVGLLTLALGGIDRAAGRRRELASLRVLGTPPSVLRRAQLLEAAIPTVTGSLLAIATGGLAGATYLRFAEIDEHVRVPWTSILTLAAVSLATALAVALVTLPTTDLRLTPDLIRQE